MRIVKDTGLSWHAVNSAITFYKEDHESSLEPKARGKKQGSGRILTQEQELEVCAILSNRTTWPKHPMWNRDFVSQLVEQTCGMTLSIRAVGNYLERWGFVLKYPNKTSYDRCTGDIKKWLDVNYADLKKDAKLSHATIYWAAKTTVKTSTYATEKDRKKLWMISAINNQGKIHWRMVRGAYNHDQQLKFLKALLRLSKNKVFLIRGDSSTYTNETVLAWLRGHQEKIEVFPDPTPDAIDAMTRRQ